MRIAKGHLRFSQKEIWNLKEYLAACIYDGLLQFKNAKRLCYPSDITPRNLGRMLGQNVVFFQRNSTDCENDPLKNFLMSTMIFRKMLKGNGSTKKS